MKTLPPIIPLALTEDIGSGDINAALIPANQLGKATIITREVGVLCGQPWVEAVFAQVDSDITLAWLLPEGAWMSPGDTVCELRGSARGLLTGERTALNFLQTLSGTATVTRHYVEKLKNTHTQLLDTRKTLPGLREAQKYAVRIGGGVNHRMGLFDAFLLKENHIMACGSITQAVQNARALAPDKTLEVEVETLAELQEALDAQVDWVMCDNFTIEQLKEAVALTRGRARLEASGNISLENIHEVASTGIDFISIGALTKHLHALDFSMRFHLG
jgi:nicotinate-nucleotide pyrophosphorylase (carboxylating)